MTRTHAHRNQTHTEYARWSLILLHPVSMLNQISAGIIGYAGPWSIIEV